MAKLIVTHPHNFDNGAIKSRLNNFLHSVPMEAYCIADGDKKIYGGKQSYEEIKKPDNRLGKVGRASLRDKDADQLVRNNRKLYLAGGNLSECLASTYSSIVRAAERNNQPVEITFLEDIIYVKAKKKRTVTTMDKFMAKASKENIEKYFSRYTESNLVEHNFNRVKQLVNIGKKDRATNIS